MFRWAIGFLVIAIIAAVLGFGGIAGSAIGAAKIVFVVALILAILGFVFGRGGSSGTVAFLLAAGLGGALLASAGSASAHSLSDGGAPLPLSSAATP
jgi:uncharacterized membrane protein YtjA (UPF0391 family)